MLRLMRFSETLKGCLNGTGLNASAKISDFEGSRKFSSRDRRPVRRSRSATAGEEGDHFDKDMVPTADHSKFFANFFDRAGNETLVPFMAFHEKQVMVERRPVVREYGSYLAQLQLSSLLPDTAKPFDPSTKSSVKEIQKSSASLPVKEVKKVKKSSAKSSLP